jgi:hypothetical protein
MLASLGSSALEMQDGVVCLFGAASFARVSPAIPGDWHSLGCTTVGCVQLAFTVQCCALNICDYTSIMRPHGLAGSLDGGRSVR